MLLCDHAIVIRSQVLIGVSLDIWVPLPLHGRMTRVQVHHCNGFVGTISAEDLPLGDIVTATESIQGGLPKFKGNSGVISLELILPNDADGSATFIVDGVRTPSVRLPAGAVVIPAACLLKQGQRVRLANLVREELK
jgi:hypothetical protein